MSKTVIVIPCYNEEARLDTTELLRFVRGRPGLELLFVDDGSRDRTAAIVEAMAAREPRVALYGLPVNRGKAEAVRQGLLHAIGRGAAVVGYTDADLSTPVDELLRMLDELERRPVAILLGARVRLLGSKIERRALRHFLGRLFATLASVALRVPVYDTQCGAKLFRASPGLAAALARPFHSRWIFDVELLARLRRGCDGEAPVATEDIRELPLAAWRDVAGSKLRAASMVRAGLQILRLVIAERLRGNPQLPTTRRLSGTSVVPARALAVDGSAEAAAPHLGARADAPPGTASTEARETSLRPPTISVPLGGSARGRALGRSAVSVLAPFAMGVLGFVLVVGRTVLDPENVGWLQRGDPAAHYLGWAFFRRGPWTSPLGANPAYGLETASGILYSDAVPLFALALKPFSPLLTQEFQYFGVWILLCFLLQSFFAWKLVGLATSSGWLRLFGSGLLVFSPPMLWRLHGHAALVGHWLVLAALLLALAPKRRSHTGWWAVLVALAALVHVYLLAMVLALWAADWASRAVLQRRDPRWTAVEPVLVGASVAAALWQAGFFLLPGGKATHGFGFYRMNLLSPFDADGWSSVLPDLPGKAGDYEGFNFLGLGLWLVVLIAVPAFVSARRRGEARFRREWAFLGVALVALFLLAVSNEVGLGLRGFSYPFPKILRPLTGFVRSSGRMFWPVWYVVALVAISLVARSFRTRVAGAFLALALAIQITDTRPGWSFFRAETTSAGRHWPREPLVSPFWDEAASAYRKLRLIPPGNVRPHWAAFGHLAARHGLSTDAVYLARMDPAAMAALDQRARDTLETARFDPDTLYILQEGSAARVADRLGDADLLTRVDGMWVVAPGWRSAPRSSDVPSFSANTPLPPDDPISFARDGTGILHLGGGWSPPEEWGVRSDADEATLRLPMDARGGRLWLRVKPFVPSGASPLEVDVSADGVHRTTWRLAEGEEAWRELEIPAAKDGARVVVVTLTIPKTRAPTGPASDGRRGHALGVVSACLERSGCPRS
jgi:hypothetical protein